MLVLVVILPLFDITHSNELLLVRHKNNIQSNKY